MKADAAENSIETTKCRDAELEVACKSALDAADELIRQKDAKTIYLESLTKMQLSQLETQSELMLDLINPPWYYRKENLLLMGFITGVILNGNTRR